MLLRDTYYLLKPAIPGPLRIAVRRFHARRLRRQFSSPWFINEIAGKAPEGWPGWPDGKKFAFVTTHDVEGRKGLERCRELAEMEMRLGFRSSFNFVPEGEYATPELLREFLAAEGFEVALHDLRHDGGLYRSRKSFRSGAEKLNRYLEAWGGVGFRSGFMLHNLDWLHDLNILYDASTFDTDPFEPQPDGVNTIFPFWVSRNGHPGYVELPYTLPQDSTLFLVLRESSIETWARKLDWVAEHGGLALVIVHPDYMSFEGRPTASEYRAGLYQDLLAYVAKHYSSQCWFALPRDVARHVRQHRRVNSGPVVDAPCLRGKRMAVVSFSSYPGDPRPRRAAEAFANEGVNVEVVCLSENERRPRHETLSGISILRLPVRHHRGAVLTYLVRYSLFILMAFTTLAFRSLTRRYHFVHVHNMPDALVLSSLVPKALGAKVILDLHDPMPELMMTIFNLRAQSFWVRASKKVERWSIAVADVVITVSGTFQKLFASRSCSPEKVHVVMNSPDGGIFKLHPRREEVWVSDETQKRFVIMYHGTLVRRNGVHLAVEALARVLPAIPSAELRIYGHPTPFLRHVMSSVATMGLGEAVHYHGPRRLEELVETIEACHVGVIPNERSVFTEINMPTRILEYLTIGRPVIAPRTSAIQEYFGDDSLVFFELGNAADLANKIEYVFSHGPEVTNIVKRGQEVCLSHTWRRERRKLVSIAAELLGKCRTV